MSRLLTQPITMTNFLKTLGLCLLPSLGMAALPAPISFTVKTFKVEGQLPINQARVDAYLQPRQQQQYTLQQLQSVAKGLEDIIREQGYPFYRISIPPQTLNGGEIKFRVVAFQLGTIDVDGNHYFSKDNIIASLPNLKPDKSPNTEELSEQLKVANKHPAKQLAVTFKESKGRNQVDAKINVNEQRPYQATAILNTLGTRGTGEFRLTAALQHSNVWGLDHIVNGSYTTSPDHADEVEQYGASYSLPWYAMKGWLSTYYAYSNVNNGTVATDLTITGSGEMYGIHYQQLLPKIGRYDHWLDIGLDNRYFTNDIQFFNIPLGNNVRSLPFSILYKAELPWQNAHLNYNLQWLSNTGIGDNNQQSDYTAARRNANQDWNSLRYGASILMNFNQWLVQTSLAGQYSQDTLIAGEQLGIGGSYDVRGYQERETSADKGEIIKFELTTPTYQQISLFTFFDYGHGHRNSPLSGELKDWNLSSTGIGANWQWRKHILTKITFAQALENAQTTQAGDSRIHGSIVLRF